MSADNDRLLVGLGGYLLGYDIYEDNTYEGDMLIPFIKKISERFLLEKPVVIADSGLLSEKNIAALEADGYEYIIGSRIKNASKTNTNKILAEKYEPATIAVFEKGNGRRLLVSFSENRARKDFYNRHRGLMRLEKRIKSGKLTKATSIIGAIINISNSK
ncbi:MAG: transposase [Tannerellaceae bacterium]|jgi:transposase|nr:transposase [Tannerellaceae bacterium]